MLHHMTQLSGAKETLDKETTDVAQSKVDANYNPFFKSDFISKRGFLPGKDPLEQLPPISEFNNRLNSIAKNIPILLENKKLREEVDKLNVDFVGENSTVAIEKGNKQQQNIAILTLAMIAQSYIFENKDDLRNIIPNAIAKNLYHICRNQQRFPTLTYADYILHNFRLKDPHKKITLDNIEPLLTFTNSKDEAWFIKIHVAIEAIGSKAMIAAYKAHDLAHKMKKNIDLDINNSETENQLTELLNTITDSFKEISHVLSIMKKECDPQYFFFILRSYVGGWENVKKMSNENKEEIGVKFEGVGSADKVAMHSYRGPTGGQSSLIPALDALLGIQHEINGMYRTLLEFHQYMPKKHSAFVNFLSNSKVNNVVDASSLSALKDARDNAQKQLELFRLHHLGTVHQFISAPAKTIGIKEDEITGTGGAPIKDYLHERYINTKKHP